MENCCCESRERHDGTSHRKNPGGVGQWGHGEKWKENKLVVNNLVVNLELQTNRESRARGNKIMHN